MPAACPVTCPCRRAGEGAFLLAGAVYAALAARAFLGTDFGAQVAAFAAAPRNVSPALVAWAAVVGAGLVLLGVALRALFEHGEGPPARSSLVVASAAALALACAWYPETWGPEWLFGFRGFYLAVIAGGGVNLCFAACARFWIAGYVAAETAGLARSALRQLRHQADAIDRLTAERDRLAHDLARVPPPALDAEAVLRFPGVSRAVLAALHPDRARSDADRRNATERFQKASAVLDRIGGRK